MPRFAAVAASLLFATICGAHEGAGGGRNFLVSEVVSGTAAEAAGVRAGDVILQVDGRKMAVWNDLEQVMAAHEPGDTVAMLVERGGETVELPLTFGARPGGGVSIGVQLEVAPDPDAEPGKATRECLAWIDDAYRVEEMASDFGLDLAQALETARACVVHDTSRMAAADAVKYCDNVFKVHCSGIDLLDLIAEAQVGRCEEQLAATLDVRPEEHEGWRTCGQRTIYDRYAVGGKASDEATCRAVFLECTGT